MQYQTLSGVLRVLAKLLLVSLLSVNLFLVDSLATRSASAAEPISTLPPRLRCQAIQTAGLHDYAGLPEDYEPSTFFESKFELRINRVLTRHLADASAATEAVPDLYLTLIPRDKSPTELQCRQVQGLDNQLGYSCSNTPPADMLLINPATLRFTRSSIGGWTFSPLTQLPPPNLNPNPNSEQEPATEAGATTSADTVDDSLFVEYGTCEAQ